MGDENEEIEITPEMVKAGVMTYYGRVLLSGKYASEEEEIVVRIFRSMWATRSKAFERKGQEASNDSSESEQS